MAIHSENKEKFSDVIDTVLFDLDGTLLDTILDLSSSVNYALHKNNLPVRTTDEILTFVGDGVLKLIEKSVPSGRKNSLFDACLYDFYDHYAENMMNQTRPYDGIPELLSSLSEKGVKIGIVSNKYDKAVKEMNDHYFSAYNIKSAVGASDSIQKKPSPESLLKAMEELESGTDSTVFVGDSEIDIKAAENTGIPFIGVAWGFRGENFLRAHGATNIIYTPCDLLEILNIKK